MRYRIRVETTNRHDLVVHLPWSAPLIGVELDERATPLPTFDHPQRGVYLLGAEDNGLPLAVLDRCHLLVQVPAPAEASLNVAVAGSLVIYDRYTHLRERAIA